jgi:hypothetical protein
MISRHGILEGNRDTAIILNGSSGKVKYNELNG